MDRISINLLPLGLKENKQLLKRRRLINSLSIGFLGVLVVISMVLVVFSVIQNRQIDSENQALSKTEAVLSSFREKEAALNILKKRLSSVSQIQNQKYFQTDSFLLVNSLLPEGTQMQSFSADQLNAITLQGFSESAQSLQQFFDNLTDPKVNEGKVVKTVISNLNRGSTPRLGFDLEITTKFEGGTK